MDAIIDYWYIFVGLLAMIILAVYMIYQYMKMPTQTQIEKLKEWLKIAVLEAERALGSKTGEAKLSYVYDLFVSRFPSLAKVLSFETFSSLVDNALEWLNKQLSTNPNIKALIEDED